MNIFGVAIYGGVQVLCKEAWGVGEIIILTQDKKLQNIENIFKIIFIIKINPLIFTTIILFFLLLKRNS